MAPVLNYEEALGVLKAKGFVLWNVVERCSRSAGSSLDVDIVGSSVVPRDIRTFCEVRFPTIQRICFGSGLGNQLSAMVLADTLETDLVSFAHAG